MIGFFLVIAWYGWQVIVILAGDRLTSLPWVPVAFTQSVIPIGSVLIALAELLTLPERWREAARPAARLHEHEESAGMTALADAARACSPWSLINVPIAVALGVIAAVAMVAKSGTDSLLAAAVTMFDGAKSFPLIAIPLFVLAGAIMNTSGISRRLIAFASALLGFIERRPVDGQHRHLDVLRRDLGLGGRRRRGDRLDPDPGDGEARLSRRSSRPRSPRPRPRSRSSSRPRSR